MEGNILVGPSTAWVGDREDTSSTRAVMDSLKADAFRLVPELRDVPFIHAYAGLRPKLVGPEGKGGIADFFVAESDLRPRWINLLGIESPGLTAAPALAEMVASIIGSKEDLAAWPDFEPGSS